MTRPRRARSPERAPRGARIRAPRRSWWAVAAVFACGLGPAVTSAQAQRTHGGPHPGNHPSQRRAIGPRPTLPLAFGAGERSARGSAAVRRLQRGLRRAGYAVGPIDGRFGPLTRAALQRFQLNHRLAPNGIVDRATHAALVAAPVLRLGSGDWSARGSAAVRALQRALRRADERPGPVDGRFGPRTLRALVDFQRSRQLAATGVDGAVTRVALALGMQRRAPSTRGRPQPLPGSGRRPARLPGPRPAPTSAVHGTARVGDRVPGLPGRWILAALAVLGCGIAGRGYARTRRRMRRDEISSPLSEQGVRR